MIDPKPPLDIKSAYWKFAPKNSPKEPKGANDPVALHNKFGALEDMDFAPSPSFTGVRSLSPRKQKGRISPIKHISKNESSYLSPMVLSRI